MSSECSSDCFQQKALFKVNGSQHRKSGKKLKLSWPGAGAATTWCTNISNCFLRVSRTVDSAGLLSTRSRRKWLSRLGLEAWSRGKKLSRVVGCPGFGWDRVNSLLSSWYSAGFWIQCENNVDNTLMSQLLLSSAYPKLRIFQFPMLCQQAGVQEAGREHSRGS